MGVPVKCLETFASYASSYGYTYKQKILTLTLNRFSVFRIVLKWNDCDIVKMAGGNQTGKRRSDRIEAAAEGKRAKQSDGGSSPDQR